MAKFKMFLNLNVIWNTNVAFAGNGFGLGEEADFGTQNCLCTTKADAMNNVQITTMPAFLQNQFYRAFFLLSSLSKYKLKPVSE